MDYQKILVTLNKPGILHVYCIKTNKSLFVSCESLLKTLIDLQTKFYDFDCTNQEILEDLKTYGPESFKFDVQNSDKTLQNPELRLQKLVEIKNQCNAPLYKSFEI